MLQFQDGLVEVPTGANALQAWCDDVAARDHVNCVGVDEYLLARRHATGARQAAIDALVAGKLAAVNLGLVTTATPWYTVRAEHIARRWLAGFATNPQVPASLRAVAAAKLA